MAPALDLLKRGALLFCCGAQASVGAQQVGSFFHLTCHLISYHIISYHIIAYHIIDIYYIFIYLDVVRPFGEVCCLVRKLKGAKQGFRV